jgi:hypothetical protein
MAPEPMASPAHTVPRIACAPPLGAGWGDAPWRAVPALEIASYHPDSSTHRPRTQARVAHDGRAVHILFRVEDRFVRCVHTEYQQSVFLDSCVEFFVQPLPGGAYFNFEANCGGTLLLGYFADPSPPPPGEFRKSLRLPWEEGREVVIRTSLPRKVDPEIREPLTWTLAMSIPFAVLERRIGPLGDVTGQRWRANFYKCGDETSHPHWGSWSPIGEVLGFHQPERFGTLVVE